MHSRPPLGGIVVFQTQVFGTAEHAKEINRFISHYKSNNEWQVLHSEIKKNFVPPQFCKNTWFSSDGAKKNLHEINAASRWIQLAINQYLCFACESGDLEKVAVLLKKRADIHFNNDSPLLRAVMSGHAKIVSLLLENGADATRNRCLVFAVLANYYDIAGMLLAYGANAHEGDPSPIALAKFFKRNDFIALLEGPKSPELR